MFCTVVKSFVKLFSTYFAQVKKFSLESIKWYFGPALRLIFAQARRFSLKLQKISVLIVWFFCNVICRFDRKDWFMIEIE